MPKVVSSWANIYQAGISFLSENHWNHNQLLSLLIKQIIEKLGQKAKVADAYLFALDTLLVAKASKQMPGIQKWTDGSGNPDRQNWIIGHNWAIGGLLCLIKNRWFFLASSNTSNQWSEKSKSLGSGKRRTISYDFWAVNRCCCLTSKKMFERR